MDTLKGHVDAVTVDLRPALCAILVKMYLFRQFEKRKAKKKVPCLPHCYQHFLVSYTPELRFPVLTQPELVKSVRPEPGLFASFITEVKFGLVPSSELVNFETFVQWKSIYLNFITQNATDNL